MNYNITLSTAPSMPRLGNGTELLKLLLTQVSKDMRQPLVPMIFPVLGAHMSGAEFQYPYLTFKEPCGMMANLVAESGGNKGQLSNLVEALCRKFRTHDETELQKLIEWQKQVKSKSANKEKPVRPEVAFWFPPADVTNAAFIQNAMACENLGGRTQYLNLPDTFNEGQLEALHVSMDKPKDAKHQLRVWVNRGFITRSNQTGLFTKTQEYLNRGK